MKDFYISTDKNQLNLTFVHDFLQRSYWAKGVPVATVAASIQNSLCFCVFTREGEQVGFARVVSDYATFAYLADVFIIEHYRDRGLSKWLMKTILAHSKLQGLRRFCLGTYDAHGLYNRFGFQPLAKPNNFLSLETANPYKNSLGPLHNFSEDTSC